jgi:starch synthase
VAVRPSIIVAHPGTQHSYQTALALQEAKLLHSYLTGLYYKPESLLCQVLSTIKPLRQRLLDRCQDGLASDRVYLHPFGELSYLVLTRMSPFAGHANQILRWRNQRFDKLVARSVRTHRPGAVLCYDTCALHAFTAAAEVGSLRILDQSIGHWRTLAELMYEESQLHPDFADSLPDHLPEWFLAQCSTEAVVADVIMVGSQYAKDTLVRHGVEPSNIAVVPYGADIERFRPARRAKQTRFRLLFVGQLSQRKGIKYLLEAVKGLSLPKLELVLVGGVVGSGSGLIPYREHFIHVPHVPRYAVHNYFQLADLLVYPSLHEGSALAIYEALASGLPVITTANSGSVIRDGVEGFIVPIRDVQALKEKILLLYEQPELCQVMAQNARKLAEQFSWAAYRRKVGDLLMSRLSQ